MTSTKWLSWFSLPKSTPTQPGAKARLTLEQMEGRLVPSATPALDLSTHGAIGTVNNAVFRQYDAQPTGSGVIQSFVRIQGTGNQAVTQGYNTDHRSLQFDENKSPTFTRSLKLSDVPVVNIGGINYREFLLDINQKASSPLLSLDELRLYSGNAGNLSGYNSLHQLANMNPVYDLGAGNWILLNGRLNQGSGKGDMVAAIPDSAFTGEYVYLYSKFGANQAGNGGFEEWASGTGLLASTGSISGTVFVGDTTTGQHIGVAPNVTVFLDANGNHVLDGDEDFTFTDVNGNYLFDDLATNLGIYSKYQVTAQAPTGATSIASEYSTGVSGITYAYANISLDSPTVNVTNVNFVVFYPVSPDSGPGGGQDIPPAPGA